MITKQITATSKSDTHLEFNVKVSMFNTEFSIPVVRHLKFITDETGKERISITVVPKTE